MAIVKSTINANGIEIRVSSTNESDYISLTDIAKKRNPEFPADVIKNWMRSRSTIEFLGLWEKLNNPNFKLVEFDQFKQEAGTNSFVLPPQNGLTVQMPSASFLNPGAMAAPMPIQILPLNLLPGFPLNLNCT